jgi:DNA-binding NtrC family response regulator
MDKIDQLIREIAEVESMLEKGKKRDPEMLEFDEIAAEVEGLNEKNRRRKRRTKKFKPQNITDLLATRIKDSLEWRNDIANAMAKSDGRVPDAAAKLGVSSRTLYRNLEEPELDDVDRAPMGRPPEG